MLELKTVKLPCKCSEGCTKSLRGEVENGLYSATTLTVGIINGHDTISVILDYWQMKDLRDLLVSTIGKD